MIQEEIKKGIKEAMLKKDSVRLNTLRLVSAALTNEVISKGKKPDQEISDQEALSVIARLAKQRKDSIEQFKKGGREDLVKEEELQLSVLGEYLPEMMQKEEIIKLAKQKKEELDITEISQKGKLMQELMKQLKGKADGRDVKEVVDQLF